MAGLGALSVMPAGDFVVVLAPPPAAVALGPYPRSEEMNWSSGVSLPSMGEWTTPLVTGK